MKRCAHDRVYSGQINLSRRYAWICMCCGEQGWSEDYVLSQVNLDQYHHLRVLHGWAVPPKLPAPPRVPTIEPLKRGWTGFAVGTGFFAFLSTVCALSAISWSPQLGPIMPLWMSLLGSGLALGTATLFFICWKQGIR